MDDYFYNDKRWDNRIWKKKAWEDEPKTIDDHPLLGWGIVLVEFLLLFIGLIKCSDLLCILSLILLFIGNPVLIIIGMIQNYRLLKRAERFNIPKNDKKVLKAKTNLITSVAGLAMIAKKTITTTKNTVCEVADPDKWDLEV